MKRYAAIILAVTMLLGVCVPALTASAEDAPQGTYGVDYVYYGDLNLDQRCDASDALTVLKAAVKKVTLTSVQTTIADVNVDTHVDASDALLILKMAVSKIQTFPAGKILVLTDPNAFPYDTSNSYNGAYEQDPTADCSFVMDNTGLKTKTIYAINSTVISDVNQKRLVVSLQGLINRDFGRDAQHDTLVYVTADTSDASWLSDLQSKGVMKDYTKKPVSSWAKFLEFFEPQLKQCGMVLWDPDVWATANAAATICGVDGYLPVLAGSSVENDLKSIGVETKLNLVGMFTGKGTIPGTTIQSTTSAKNDVYYWLMEKYMNRCSANYVAYVLDGAVTIPNTGFTNASNCLLNHDYLIARRAFFFDLDPCMMESACDDPRQPKGLDYKTMTTIMQRRFDRAKGAFGMAMGFPPWWAKYCATHGGGMLTDGNMEAYYSEIVACYNLAMEADAAQPAEMSNGSVYYKYVPQQKKYTTNRPANKTTFEKGKYYFTVYVGDYDSSAWMKKYVHSMWLQGGGDTARGKLPLMWSYNPNLAWRIPNVFEYVRTNATANDYFAAGDSGAGYISPSALFCGQTLDSTMTKRPSANGDAGNLFAQYSKKFYDLFDLTITGFIIDYSGPLDTKVMGVYNQISPTGSLYYKGNDDRLVIYNGVPYCQCRIGVGKGNSEYLYNWATGGMNGYHFAAYRTVSWTPTEIKNTVDGYITYAAGKGKTMVYVDPYTFFDLIRQSGEGVVEK